MGMDIKVGRIYQTTEGAVRVTGQAVPRQAAGIADFNVRPVDQRHSIDNILFTSRSREEALDWVAKRIQESADQSIETGKCQYSSPYSPRCGREIEVLAMDDILMDESLIIGRCRKHTAGYVVIGNA